MHDAHIRHRRLGQHAGNILGSQRPFQCAHIVELHDLGRDCRIHRRPNVPAPWSRCPVGLQCDERLIHRPVIAPVKDQNLRPPRDLPRQPDRKPIRVGSGERELPIGQKKSLLQFLGHENRIFPGQHQRDAASRLLFHRLDRGGRRMSRHRPCIAQAKVGVTMPVHIEEVSPLRLPHERRKRSCPLHHPVHGNACQQRLSRPLKQRLRLWALIHKLLLFALHQGLQAAAINSFHGKSKR